MPTPSSAALIARYGAMQQLSPESLQAQIDAVVEQLKRDAAWREARGMTVPGSAECARMRRLVQLRLALASATAKHTSTPTSER